jgi:hypothetical protein
MLALCDRSAWQTQHRFAPPGKSMTFPQCSHFPCIPAAESGTVAKFPHLLHTAVIGISNPSSFA